MIKFATFVMSKMGNTSYTFLSSVYNLPSSSTLNQYATLNSNAQDGILHQTLSDMEHNFEMNHGPYDTQQLTSWKY